MSTVLILGRGIAAMPPNIRQSRIKLKAARPLGRKKLSLVAFLNDGRDISKLNEHCTLLIGTASVTGNQFTTELDYQLMRLADLFWSDQ